MNETEKIMNIDEAVEEKPYVLRDLKSEDMFPMFKILSKIGFKEFKTCFDNDSIKALIADAKTGDPDAGRSKKDELVASVGISVMIDMAGIVLENIPKCKTEIYVFLSGLSGMTKEEIADLDMVVFAEMIVDVFKKDQFKDFFKVVSKLFN